MRDKDLYATILGITAPWLVRDVDLRAEAQEVEVFIEYDATQELACPECGTAAVRHDARRRTWRHLDTCQYRTTLTAEVPRVKCPKHGVRQVAVPWSERGSRFTAMFECLAIDWVREASVSAVAPTMSWRCRWSAGRTTSAPTVAMVPGPSAVGMWQSWHERKPSPATAQGELSHSL